MSLKIWRLFWRHPLVYIKYSGPLGDLESVVEAGVKSPQFLTLVRFLVKELTSLCNLQGHDDLKDADIASEAGMMELSSFLRDLKCPHSVLTEGPVNQRLENKKAKLRLIDFLLSEMVGMSDDNNTPHEEEVEDQLILDGVNVDSYGEVYLEMFKPKIKKKIFEDQIKKLSANEIKEQIMTPSGHQFMKICPHGNKLNNLQNPGIRVGITLRSLYNFEKERIQTSKCIRCRMINGEERNHLQEASTVRDEDPVGSNGGSSQNDVGTMW